MEEKKTTKYDLKQKRRMEQEEKDRRFQRNVKIGFAAVAIVCIGAAGYKIYNNYQEKYGPYLEIGSHDIDKTEYEYYYNTAINSFYSTYGDYASYFGLDLSQPLDQQSYSDTMTWKDYFDEEAVNQMKQVYALLDDASTNGFTYDATADYDSFVTSLNEYADTNSTTTEAYAKQLFGDDATLEKLETYIVNDYTANAYYDSVDDATTVTDDEINTYYDENASEYDSVDYMMAEIDADIPETETEAETEAETVAEAETTDETAATETETMSEEEIAESESIAAEEEAAQEAAVEAAMTEASDKANEMMNAITDKTSFKSLVAKYATDTTADYDFTDVQNSSVSQADVATWLFDSARAEGDVTVIEDTTNNAYYVVMFGKRYLDHINTVDVRHILIQPETSESEETEAETEATEAETTETEAETTEAESVAESEAESEAANAAAKTKAEEIYKEWQDGDATEDSFAALAEANSSDTGSSTNGGLYEAVKPGDMVAEFNDWIFDDARKPGDTSIVESSYDYHIMYFVGDNEESWKASIRSTLKANKMSDFVSALTDALTVSDPRKHVNYLHIETEAETESETATETVGETETVAETGAETETVLETEAAGTETTAETEAASEAAETETETETAAK